MGDDEDLRGEEGDAVRGGKWGEMRREDDF